MVNQSIWEELTMRYNTKLPKNSKGYTVGNRVFSTLHQAEVHCEQCDLDPNESIDHNPEESRRIAMGNYNACEVIIEKLQGQYNALTVNIDRLSSDIDKLRANPTRMSQMTLELTMDSLRDVAGLRGGIGDALKTIRCFKMESEDIVRCQR